MLGDPRPLVKILKSIGKKSKEIIQLKCIETVIKMKVTSLKCISYCYSGLCLLSSKAEREAETPNLTLSLM